MTGRYYVSASKGRQAKVLHAGPVCPLALDMAGKKPVELVLVDPATLRVFVRCKYCFG
jgi:hypothetical protein